MRYGKVSPKGFLLKRGTVRRLLLPDFQVFSFIKHFMLLNYARVRVENEQPTKAFKHLHSVEVFELIFCESTSYQCEILPNYNDCDAQCDEAVLQL